MYVCLFLAVWFACGLAAFLPVFARRGRYQRRLRPAELWFHLGFCLAAGPAALLASVLCWFGDMGPWSLTDEGDM